ncbi:hypothetical protein L3X38_024788 [Prunus dulcis]|uniref:Uncharacterized protein n=1 Tax=Prunus dulcis TaxID=3755 RepID=A0AAD4W0I8_PRUDU|nr:hypothetical protein L3X38_024788 [Prunus dulcis]
MLDFCPTRLRDIRTVGVRNAAQVGFLQNPAIFYSCKGGAWSRRKEGAMAVRLGPVLARVTVSGGNGTAKLDPKGV